MTTGLEMRGMSAKENVLKGIGRQYDVSFQLMVVLCAEKINSCEAQKKYNGRRKCENIETIKIEAFMH